MSEESRGAPAIVMLFVGISVMGGLGFMMFAFTAALEGQLTAGESLGSVVFEPDDCTAGSIHGFGGVQLTDGDQSSVRVRVLETELGQWRLAWIRQGAEPEVFDGERCDAFSANVEFSGTVLNDVRAMQGYVELECPELSGRVTFDGCGP